MTIRIKPVALSAEQMEALAASAQKQSDPNARGFTRSNDEENYPVWTSKESGKFLMYIPNHVVVGESGEESLRMDKPYLHSVKDGSRYGRDYRCTMGIQGEDFDGTCPLCEAAQESWNWYFRKLDALSAQTGVDFQDKSNEAVKATRSSLSKDLVVQQARGFYTFPIIHIETDDKASAIKVEDKKLQYKAYWISMSQPQWDKLMSALDSAEGLTTPAGQMFVFNYNYDTKGAKPNKMDAARNLTISLKPSTKGITDKVLMDLDSKTEDWTPAKAMEMVKSNALFDTDSLRDLCYGAGGQPGVMTPVLREIEVLTKQIAGAGDSKSSNLKELAAPDFEVNEEVDTDFEEVGTDFEEININ